MTNPQTVIVLQNGARVTLNMAIEDVHADFRRRFENRPLAPNAVNWWEPTKSASMRLDCVIAIAVAETVNLPSRKTETAVQRDVETGQIVGSIAIEADA